MWSHVAAGSESRDQDFDWDGGGWLEFSVTDGTRYVLSISTNSFRARAEPAPAKRY